MSAVLPPQTRLGEVSLRVSQLERSVRFYTEVVGLEILSIQGKSAVLTADGTHPLVVLEEEAATSPKERTAGLYHIAILVPDRPSLGLVVRNLINRSVPAGQGDHLVSEALYINDPDQNGIEIYADRPRELWKWELNGDVAMATDPVDIDGLLAESEGLEWNGLPAGTVIGHVHFQVSSLREASYFYCDILGFERTAHYGNAALFVSAGGYHHHIGLNVWAGAGIPNTPKHAPGMNYFTLILPDQEEVKQVVDRIHAAGLRIVQQGNAFYVKDPSDIEVCITAESAA